MQDEYRDKIDATLKELLWIKKKINKMQNSAQSIKKLPDINVYKNYAVILAYGCLENITKNIVADYYKSRSMPLRCQQFAARLLGDKYALSIEKESFYKFFKKECSHEWFDEMKRREKADLLDKRYKKYRYSKMWMAVNFIFQERCSFAHGQASYQGTINELIENFYPARSWLYEVDHIVSSNKFHG